MIPRRPPIRHEGGATDPIAGSEPDLVVTGVIGDVSDRVVGLSGASMSGATWMLGRRAFGMAVRIGVVAVLARQLTPAQFGLVALAQVCLQFGTLFTEGGIGTFVIFDAEDGRERRAHAAFWLNAMLTLGQVLLVVAATPLMTRIYPQNGLAPVLLVLAFVFFVQQMTVVPASLVRREMGHAKLARRDMALDVLIAAIGIAMALGGAGVWSLVLPLVVVEPLRFVWTLLVGRWRPRRPFCISEWRAIMRYSWKLVVVEVLGLVANDGDTLIVGRVLGSASLGFYSVAWQLSNLVGRNVTSVASSVTLPALAKVRDDAERFRAAFTQILATLSLVCFPILTLLFVLADDLIAVAYGDRWRAVVPLLRIFIVFTLVRSITSPSSNVYNLLGRTDVGLKFVLAFAPIYLTAVVLGVRHGITGVAVGVCVVRTGGAIVDTLIAARMIQLTPRRVCSAVAPAAGLAATAAAAAFGIRLLVGGAGAGALVTMTLAGGAGGVVYLAGVAITRPPGFEQLRRIGRRKRAVRRAEVAGGRA